MKTKNRLLSAVAAVIMVVAGAGVVLAHNDDDKRGHMMGGHMMGGHMMGGHMMGGGMMGQSMMGGGMMMGPGMMGRGMMGGGYHGRVTPSQHLTVDDVKHWFGHRLERMGNKRLKLGKVTEKDKDTFIAEIVTKDGALVDKFEVSRHGGRMRRVDD